MSSRASLGEIFTRCSETGRAAFIPFLVAGDPDVTTSRACIDAAAKNGADILEIGIPYSDPLADGPTIARASERARQAGMTFEDALRLAASSTGRNPGVAMIAFTYYNPVYVRGIERTVSELADAGLRGIIVPDLPFAEARPLREACVRHNLAATFLIAPTTPAQRAQQIAEHCSDFVYVVSRMGTTGAYAGVGEALPRRLAALRALTRKPLAVGFGVNSPAAAARIAAVADGVIVGSALIDRMEAASSAEDAVAAVGTLCSQLATACRRVPTSP